jgi:hypothetical protein
MFVDREEELAFFNRVATRQRPGPAQLLLLYGRRRIGKTELLLHWSRQSGIPTTYWTAEKEPAALQRRKLFAAISGTALQYTPIFASWSELWDAAAQLIGDQRRALVLLFSSPRPTRSSGSSRRSKTGRGEHDTATALPRRADPAYDTASADLPQLVGQTEQNPQAPRVGRTQRPRHCAKRASFSGAQGFAASAPPECTSALPLARTRCS